MGKKPKKPKGAITFFNNAWYSLKDLKDTINCANSEAQGYLDTLNRLRAEVEPMKRELNGYKWRLSVIKQFMD